MNRLSPGLWITVILLPSVFLLCACATAPNVAPKLYVNKDLGFSVTYPDNWEPYPLLPGVVLNVHKPNAWKIPMLTAAVGDIDEGAKLEDSADRWIEAVRKTIPQATQFTVLSKEMIKLEDGTPASSFVIKWTWTDGVTRFISGAVTAFEGKKTVNVTATTVLGREMAPAQLLSMCRTLKFH